MQNSERAGKSDLLNRTELKLGKPSFPFRVNISRNCELKPCSVWPSDFPKSNQENNVN